MLDTSSKMTQLEPDNPIVLLQAVVCEALGSPHKILVPTMHVTELPGWHSFANVDIVMRLEEILNVEFDYTELSRLRTVSDYLRLIELHRRIGKMLACREAGLNEAEGASQAKWT